MAQDPRLTDAELRLGEEAAVANMGPPLLVPSDSMREYIQAADREEQLAADFDDAFADAQAEFGVIERNRTVKVKSKSTGVEYDFKYAELSVILAACRPALNKHGISFRQFVRIKSATEHVVVTQLRRKGFKIEDEFPMNLPQSNHPQDYGAAVSYAKRLGGQATLGVVGEDDNDGNGPEDMRGPPVVHERGKGGKQQVAEATAKAAFPKTAPEPAPAAPEKVYTDAEMADMEGKITDYVGELLEAAHEGRRIGIEQIWGEIKSNEYIGTRVWRILQERSPDLFRTIKDVVAPTEKKGPRGPKPKP